MARLQLARYYVTGMQRNELKSLKSLKSLKV